MFPIGMCDFVDTYVDTYKTPFIFPTFTMSAVSSLLSPGFHTYVDIMHHVLIIVLAGAHQILSLCI